MAWFDGRSSSDMRAADQIGRERAERLAQQAIAERMGEQERLSALELERAAGRSGFEAARAESAQASYYPGHHVPERSARIGRPRGRSDASMGQATSAPAPLRPTGGASFVRPASPPSSYNPLVQPMGGGRGIGRVLLVVLVAVVIAGILALLVGVMVHLAF